MKKWWVLRIVKGILFVAIGLAVFGWIVMMLWNVLIPEIFKGPELTFWQSIGLLILSHILLRGWAPWRHSNGWRRERWKRRFEDRLAAMSPEEREKFKEEWKHRCGWHDERKEEKGQANA